MWWSSVKSRPAATALAVVLVLSIASCGFRPLYGGKSGGAVESQLARVKIGTISNRVGQQVHNYLLDGINRKGRPADPLYLLSVNLTLTNVRLGIERDQTATRAKLVVVADVVLQEIETESVLLKRNIRSTNSYNIVQSTVITRSAELDAIDRAAREVSNEIQLMLSLYFRRLNAQTAAQ